MKLLSFFYGLVVAIRRGLYACGFFSSYRPKVFTISVGNIVAGGAGKTPCTLFLAELLEASGPVAVICRPYKAKAEHCTIPFQVDPVKHKADLVGDEPLLIAKRLPNVAVWVGKKKEAARMAEAAGAKVIIVDDGFQHFALERDLDIVVIDAAQPCRGLCREPLSSLKRASCIFINSRTLPLDTSALQNELLAYTCAPMVTVSYKIDGFYDLQNKQRVPPKKAALFCAIANPDQFKKTIELEGLEVVDCLFGKDHDTVTQSELEQFAKSAEALICTEKDRVKLHPSKLPILWLKISLAVEKKEEMDIIASLLSR